MFRIKRGRRTNVERETWQEDKCREITVSGGEMWREKRNRWTNVEEITVAGGQMWREKRGRWTNMEKCAGDNRSRRTNMERETNGRVNKNVEREPWQIWRKNDRWR